MNDVLIDLIKYFSQFPEKESVLKLFTRGDEKLSGYDDLRTYVQNLPAGLVPDLTSFVVSTDEKVLKEAIQSQKGYIMLLEYFNFNTTAPNRQGTRETTFSLSVSILHNYDNSGTDVIEEALIMNQCLNYILDIKKFILEDDVELCAWLRYLDSGITITPVEPYFAWQNMGWSMTFEKQIDGLI